jgi:hypothetical protein
MTEAMLQFAALVSKDGMSGFAPISEFECPTRSGAGSRINTLAGFTSTIGGRGAVFNQALHSNPREDGVDASAALVFRPVEGRGHEWCSICRAPETRGVLCTPRS